MITYKKKDDSKKDSAEKVLLDGKVVGVIRPIKNDFDGGVKWQYVPKGQKVGGGTFATIEECKRSLESD